MNNIKRSFDVSTPKRKVIQVNIDGKVKTAFEGETVLSTLLAHGIRNISKNDHEKNSGPYCGMGICFCCNVLINSVKRRACKAIVKPEMEIRTKINTKAQVENYLQYAK